MSIISEWKWVISQTGKIYEHHQLKRNSERGERKRGRGKREREGRRERSRQKGDLFFTLTFIVQAARGTTHFVCTMRTGYAIKNSFPPLIFIFHRRVIKLQFVSRKLMVIFTFFTTVAILISYNYLITSPKDISHWFLVWKAKYLWINRNIPRKIIGIRGYFAENMGCPNIK